MSVAVSFSALFLRDAFVGHRGGRANLLHRKQLSLEACRFPLKVDLMRVATRQRTEVGQMPATGFGPGC
jgi:hypothetical protein